MIKEIRRENNGLGEYLVYFLVDAITDIADVSTKVAIGSQILCLENKKTYVLSTVRVWTEV